jgi:hypothetical protein
LDVIADQLLFKVESLAHTLHSLRKIVDLEQKQYVVFIDLGIITLDEGVDVTYNTFLFHLHHGFDSTQRLCLIILVQVEIAFEKSMI